MRQMQSKVHRWILASLEEKLEIKKSKNEEPNEVKEVEKCILTQVLKFAFPESLNDLRTKHKFLDSFNDSCHTLIHEFHLQEFGRVSKLHVNGGNNRR